MWVAFRRPTFLYVCMCVVCAYGFGAALKRLCVSMWPSPKGIYQAVAKLPACVRRVEARVMGGMGQRNTALDPGRSGGGRSGCNSPAS